MLGEERVHALDHPEAVEHDLAQDEEALPSGGDFRDIVEIAFDDDGAGHAARHLNIGAAVMMGMIPVGAGRVVGGDGDLDVVALARFHRCA